MIEELIIKVEEQHALSLQNVKISREMGEREAELIANGETLAFAIVIDILKEIQAREATTHPAK